MICLDEEIRMKFKLRIFRKVFQITKIIEFEIHSKRKEIEILQFLEFLMFQIKGINLTQTTQMT